MAPLSKYTYSIFDSNPHMSGGTTWPDHDDNEIAAESDDEAVDAVRDILETEAAGLDAADGYDVGQAIHALVWDADGLIVGDLRHMLTADDLA